MRRRWCGIGGTLVLLLGAFFVGLAHTRTGDRPARAVVHTHGPRSAPDVAAEVRAQLEAGYYRPLGDDVLGRPSVRRMIQALHDPYTEYLSPRDFAVLENKTEGRYSGVGLSVDPAKNGLVVTSAFDGPAREAGIRRGDVIVSIDGRPAGRMAFERSLYLIQGEEGTTVRLTVNRPRIGKLKFTLVRQELPAPTIRSSLVRLHGTKLGYVRLYSFAANASDDLRRATERLVARGARGLVLDLRDNPGGLLLEAVGTVSVFLRNGVVCSTSGAHQARRVFRVVPPTPFPKLPLAVLVNHGSASASEIVAAALAEDGRAVVVGRRTYGKAAVQSVHELSNGAALKLTTALYVTPDGRDLLGSGVRPRVRTLDDPATPRDEALAVAERVLSKRLG